MKMLWKNLLGLVVASLALPVFATSHSVMVEAPWVQEAPPTAKVMAAYMVLKNHSGEVQVLSSASSPAFERVEIHNTEISEGMARMVRHESVEIAAHGDFEFKPGSYHFMLINAKQALKAGDKVHLMLNFANGSEMGVDAVVRKAMGGMDHSGHTMDHAAHEPQKPMQHSGSMQHNH